jgi:hypothetical protein
MSTMMTENFTYLEKDLSDLHFNVNTDIDLLFNEVTLLKRKVYKLERRFEEK